MPCARRLRFHRRRDTAFVSGAFPRLGFKCVRRPNGAVQWYIQLRFNRQFVQIASGNIYCGRIEECSPSKYSHQSSLGKFALENQSGHRHPLGIGTPYLQLLRRLGSNSAGPS